MIRSNSILNILAFSGKFCVDKEWLHLMYFTWQERNATRTTNQLSERSLLVIIWFLFGEVSSSFWCLGCAALFYCGDSYTIYNNITCGTSWTFHIIIYLDGQHTIQLLKVKCINFCDASLSLSFTLRGDVSLFTVWIFLSMDHSSTQAASDNNKRVHYFFYIRYIIKWDGIWHFDIRR